MRILLYALNHTWEVRVRVQLKFGASRNALILGSLVFKFPCLTSWRLLLQGLLANMRERELSKAHDKYCPVWFGLWGGFVNVMAYARPLTDEEWRQLDASQFSKFRRTAGGVFLPNIEHKRNSLGFVRLPHGEQAMVAVDYGG